MRAAHTPWRSVLFVPAHVERFVHAAADRGADAVQLDLEDSVPLGHKAAARAALAPAIARLAGSGLDVLVRINRDLRSAVADLEAAVSDGLRAISVPKTSGAEHLQLIDELLTELEQERRLPPGGIGLVAMVETLEGLAQAETMATACPRMCGLTLGSEDFSAAAGMEPSPRNLFHPCQRLLFAARAGGIGAYGFPGSIAEFAELDRYRAQVTQGKAMGFDGAFCIHPSQVTVLNAVFEPAAEELAQARAVIAAYEAAMAQGLGAASLEGRMIDLPVVQRARAVLARSRQPQQLRG
jgi:citrate lyase subunit beta/citryl-CoA lyase